jgi:acyl-CoA dehydrogenase
VFGTAAPDTGNTEVLAHYGTEAQKARFLQPLMEDEICSCYSMTELHGGSDPTQFKCRAELSPDGTEWIINGEKIWSSNGPFAAFFLVMAVTDPDAARHSRASMFIVPADTPGVEIVRNLGLGSVEPAEGGDHAHMRYTDVRVPFDHLLGRRGGGFETAQVRLSGGRIHHGMRAIGVCKRAFDMMCERAKARTTAGEPLAAKQLTQEKIARSWMELEQFKLLTLRTAWLIDQNPKSYKPYLRDIAAVKVAMAEVNESVVARSQRVHGGLGFSWDLPLAGFMEHAQTLYAGDGPIELHMMTVAKESLKHVRGPEDEFELHFTKHNILRRTKAALDRCIPKLKAAGVDPACVTPHRDAKL